jgi:hypothetical protein
MQVRLQPRLSSAPPATKEDSDMASKTFIAAGLGAGLLLGGVAGLAVAVPTGAFAQDADTSETVPTDSGPMGSERGGRMQEHLNAKVADGTITQEQADALIADAEARRAEHGSEGHPGERGGMHGRMGGGAGGPGGMRLETAAEAIGISTDELRTQLRDGNSLAAIAEANGVTTDALVDSLTAEARTRITDMVNRVPGERMGNPDAQADGGN